MYVKCTLSSMGQVNQQCRTIMYVKRTLKYHGSGKPTVPSIHVKSILKYDGSGKPTVPSIHVKCTLKCGGSG